MTNELAAVLALWLAVIYWARLRVLRYSFHGLTFVAAQAISGAACGYAGYDLWERGMDASDCFIILMAASYLFRSRSTYIESVTKPMALDDYDLTHSQGARK